GSRRIGPWRGWPSCASTRSSRAAWRTATLPDPPTCRVCAPRLTRAAAASAWWIRRGTSSRSRRATEWARSSCSACSRTASCPRNASTTIDQAPWSSTARGRGGDFLLVVVIGHPLQRPGCLDGADRHPDHEAGHDDVAAHAWVGAEHLGDGRQGLDARDGEEDAGGGAAVHTERGPAGHQGTGHDERGGAL